MDWRDLLGLTILLAVVAVEWLTAYAWHKTCRESSSDSIHVPRAIGVLFGSYRSDGVLNYRGVVLQLAIYIATPVVTLLILGVIPHQIGISCLGWSGLGLVTLALILAFRKR